jgi:hypothetical protein
VVVAFAGFDVHMGGRDGAALHFRGGDLPAFEAQLAQLGFDGAEVGAGIDEGAEDHVSADAGEAVEVGCASEGHGDWMLAGFK